MQMNRSRRENIRTSRVEFISARLAAIRATVRLPSFERLLHLNPVACAVVLPMRFTWAGGHAF